jgi:hypothetical protein
LRFVRGATEGERFIEAKSNAEIENPRLTEETLMEFEDRTIRFINAFVEGMGDDKFKNRESLHLTSPGWGALGVIFHDLVYRLRVPDFEASARAIGSRMNWHRSGDEWTEIVTQKTDTEGNVELGLARGGAQVRRYITAKVRDTLGISSRLAELDGEMDRAA